jgi:hypothetical protein
MSHDATGRMAQGAVGNYPDVKGSLVFQAGVTLVELVIAVFLGGVVFLGLGYVFGLNYGLWLRGQDRMVLHAGAARALEQIVQVAGQASGFSIPEEGELRIFSPPSPLGDTAASGFPSETVFRLQDDRLLRNGEPLVPHLGDSAAIRVASFDPRLVVAEGSGVRTLQVRLSLYTVGGPSAPAETLHFETAAHGRNIGLGLAGGSDGIAESDAGGSTRMGSAL